MSQAEDIRKFTYKHYILPARNKNATQVTIRAGDIHSKMGLKSRMPAVCGALGTKIFEDTYKNKWGHIMSKDIKKDKNHLLLKSINSLRDKNPEDAIRYLEDAINIDPDFGEAYLYLARSYAEIGDKESQRVYKEYENASGKDENTIKEERLKKLLEDDVDFKKFVKDMKENLKREMAEYYEKEEKFSARVAHYYEKSFRYYLKSLELCLDKEQMFEEISDFANEIDYYGFDWSILYELIEKAISLNITNKNAWFNLGAGFIDGGNWYNSDLSVKIHEEIKNMIKSSYRTEEIEYWPDKKIPIVMDEDIFKSSDFEDLNTVLNTLYNLYRDIDNIDKIVETFWDWYTHSKDKINVVETFVIDYIFERKHIIRNREKKTTDKRDTISEEERERKNQANEIVDEIMDTLKSFIWSKLEKEYGDLWWEDATRDIIINKEKAFTLKSKGELRKIKNEEKNPDWPSLHPFKYLEERDYVKIILHEKNWPIFQKNFGTPYGGIWNELESFFGKRNLVKHGTRILEDYEILELKALLKKINRCIEKDI